MRLMRYIRLLLVLCCATACLGLIGCSGGGPAPGTADMTEEEVEVKSMESLGQDMEGEELEDPDVTEDYEMDTQDY